jgi:hypothetical protein
MNLPMKEQTQHLTFRLGPCALLIRRGSVLPIDSRFDVFGHALTGVMNRNRDGDSHTGIGIGLGLFVNDPA